MDRFIRLAFTLLSWTIILFALATIGLRISLANIDSYKSEIESWIARDVIPGASFVALQGGWNQFNPVLHLTRASIILPNKSEALVIDEIVVEFDYFRSLWYRTPVVSEVTGVLAKLSVRKDPEQKWWLNDIPLSFTSSNQTISSFEELVEQMPEYIQLELDQLEINDEASGQKYRIDQVRVDMQQREQSIHWQLRANLPEALGKRIDIKSIVKPDNSVVYLKSDSIELTRVAELFDIKVGNLKSAELGGELWINLIDNRTPVLNGKVLLTRGLWKTNPETKPLQFALSARVNASRIDKQWNLGGYFESLSIDNQVLYGFKTQVQVASVDSQTQIQGWVEEFELHNMVLLQRPLMTVEIAEMIEQSQLQGRLKDVWFSFDLAHIGDIEISANIVDFSSRPVNAIPGIESINASFTLGRQNATVQLNGKQMALDFVDQFRAPLEFDRLQLQANASLVNNTLVISIPDFEGGNADIRIGGRMQLETDPAAAPFLYLRAQFEDGRGSSNGKYLPLNLLPEEVVSWLDRGIKEVDISAGEVLFHGRVDGISLFGEQNTGEMVVDFDINNAEILFDPEWAPVREAGGRVMFHNSGMEITVDRIKYDQVESGKGRILIADLPNAVVEIDLETSTAPDSALKTWFNVPLGREQAFIGKYLRDIEGSVRANLDITIPVNNEGVENRVDVKLIFDRASFRAPAWGLELSNVNGEVRVTDKGVTGKGINASYFKDPIVVDISNSAGNRQTIVLARGQIDSGKVLNRLPDFINRRFEGRSPWQIRVAIANQKENSRIPIIHIRATSELENTAVLLPEPLSKKPELKRDLYAQLEIFEIDDIDFKLDYGTLIKARGRFHTDKRGDYRLAAMDIGFSTPLKQPIPRGLRVYGSLQKLPLDEWIVLRKSILASETDNSNRLADILEAIDLKIQSVSFFGHNSLNADFNLIRTPLGFTGTIDSSLLKGSYDVPFASSAGNPITADLEYVKYRSTESESESTGVIPQDLFDIRLRSNVFEYNDVLFSNLILDTHLEKDALVIDSLEVRRNDLAMKLNARWQYIPAVNEHFTTLNMSIKGKKFGQTIASLDFGDIMKDGEADIEGRAGWSGELLRLDWGSLIGEAKFNIVDGILKDVQPGTGGRLVGLLSLNALPRRLILDFGDVIIDGMQFDKLTGSFKIDQGNLYTNNTRLDAPSARIKISGRTGLLHRDYDQTMIIIPKIGNTLPLITGLTWGNAVGWGVLILKSLIKKKIDRSVEIEYKVTGTWDNPILEKIRDFEEDKPRARLEDGSK